MRNLLIAIVIFSAAGLYVGRDTLDFVTRWTDTPGAYQERQSRPAAAPTHRGAKREYFQFVDADGNVRFATSLDQIPQEKRATAGRMFLDRPPPTAPGEAYTWKAEARRTDAARVRSEAARAGPAQPAQPAQPHNVTDAWGNTGVVIFVGPDCSDCSLVSEYLRREGVNFSMKNIRAGNKSLTELTERTGSAEVPTVVYGGMVVQGYRPDELDAIVLRVLGAS